MAPVYAYSGLSRSEGSKPSQLTITLSGQVIHSSEIRDGIFRVEAPVDVDAQTAMHLQVSNTQSFTTDNDARRLCFVLRELAFL